MGGEWPIIAWAAVPVTPRHATILEVAQDSTLEAALSRPAKTLSDYGSDDSHDHAVVRITATGPEVLGNVARDRPPVEIGAHYLALENLVVFWQPVVTIVFNLSCRRPAERFGN